MKKILSTLIVLAPLFLFGQTTPTMRQVANAGTSSTKLPSNVTATVSPTDTMMVFKSGIWQKTKISAIASGGGAVTSVSATSPLSSSGGATPTISITSPLPIVNGGTNATTANSGFNNLAPSQATHSGKFLTTDGTNTSWGVVSGWGLSGNALTGTEHAPNEFFGSTNDFDVVFKENNAEVMRLTDGAVSINGAALTAFGEKLSVSGNVNIDGNGRANAWGAGQVGGVPEASARFHAFLDGTSARFRGFSAQQQSANNYEAYGFYSLMTGTNTAFDNYGMRSITSNSTTNNYCYYAQSTGSQTGTPNSYGFRAAMTNSASQTLANTYGVYSDVDVSGGTSATLAVGGYFKATGATNNYAIITDGGFSGFGTSSPTAQVDVKGSGATSATYALKVQNSASTDLFRIYNSGQIYAGVGTNLFMGISSGLSFSGTGNTSFGYNSLEAITSGGDNVAIGTQALEALTAGSRNIAVGFQALTSQTATNAAGNVAIGWRAGAANTSGYSLIAIGHEAAVANTTGLNNVAIGESSLLGNTTGGNNVAIGILSLRANNSDGCVALGYGAGRYETAANKLFIDNQLRNDEADGRIKALVYGIFDASVANQRFTVNGIINSGTTQTTTASSTSGDVTFSQPFGGVAFKKIVIYLNASTGTTSYTFPIAFTNTPGIVVTSVVGAAVVTTLSTTAVTVTGAATSGFIFLEGY